MELKQFIFDEPTKVISGIDSIKELKNEVARLSGKSILVVCDKGIADAGLANAVTDELKNINNLDVNIYDKIIPNPLDTTMDDGYEYAKAKNTDLIIGIGGGSSLDSAKGIALLLSNGGKMREYLMEGKVPEKKIAPTICIPTTAGTGSEVTRTIVATDHVTRFKDGFKYADTIYADTAILDPTLMLKLPAHVLAACGMDALTHAIESFITWKSNPLTDSINSYAIKLIGENLRRAFAQPDNLEAKKNLLLASAMTGIAFDQAGLGLAHCMGHPMGGLFNIPHGVACAMALPVSMEYNLISAPEKFIIIANLLGRNTANLDLYDAAYLAIDAVRKLMADLNLPTKLDEVGIAKDDIPALAKDAVGFPGMLGANPRSANKDDVAKLFEKLL